MSQSKLAWKTCDPSRETKPSSQKENKKNKEAQFLINSMLKAEIKKKISVKEIKIKDRCQSELIFHISDPGHQTGIITLKKDMKLNS